MADSAHTPTVTAPAFGRSVSINQAAQILGVCRRTVYNRIRGGHLRTIRTAGGSQRVLLSSIDACVPASSSDSDSAAHPSAR